MNLLADHRYVLYIIHDTANNVWDCVQNKYNTKEDVSKEFVVSRYLNYKMTDDKFVEEQSQELHNIAHEIFVEGMQLPKQVQIVVVIDKLPSTWKDFKNNLRQKTKEFVSLITQLRIEEEARKQELNEEMFVVSNNNTKKKFVGGVQKPNGKQFKNQNQNRPANKNSNRNKNENPQ